MFVRYVYFLQVLDQQLIIMPYTITRTSHVIICTVNLLSPFLISYPYPSTPKNLKLRVDNHMYLYLYYLLLVHPLLRITMAIKSIHCSVCQLTTFLYVRYSFHRLVFIADGGAVLAGECRPQFRGVVRDRKVQRLQDGRRPVSHVERDVSQHSKASRRAAASTAC